MALLWAEILLTQTSTFYVFSEIAFQDFPGDAVDRNPPADTGDGGSISGPGRSHMPQSS